MPDTAMEQAKKALKKTGKLTFDPAAYTAGFLDGVKAAKIVVIESLEKYMEAPK